MHSKLKIGEMDYIYYFTLHCRLLSNRKVHVLYVHVHKYYTKLNHSRGGSSVPRGSEAPPPPPTLNAALVSEEKCRLAARSVRELLST